MAWVNGNHTLSTLLGLVGDEAFQLSKAPTVQPSLQLALALLDATTNVRQVLQHIRGASRAALDDVLAQYVVTVPVEAQVLATQLFQVAFGRLRSLIKTCKSKFAFAVNQISRRGGCAQILRGIGGNREEHHHAPSGGGQIDLFLGPIDRVGMQIIAGGAGQSFAWGWLTCLPLAFKAKALLTASVALTRA